MMVCKVLFVLSLQQHTAILPIHLPSRGQEERSQKQRTGQPGSQRSTFLTHTCLWFISSSLLEHFSDSNSEISVLSTSFPCCWEQITPFARFLSHYLLRAFQSPLIHLNTQAAQEQHLLHPDSSTNPQQCDTSFLIYKNFARLGELLLPAMFCAQAANLLLISDSHPME